MKRFLPAILALLALCSACVDPEYNLDNIKTEGTILRNLEVPIGNFQIITIETILKAQGAELVPIVTRPGAYSLRGWAEINGVNLEIEEGVYFKNAELHTVIVNTLPLDMNFTVQALDAEGQPCKDVKVSVQSDASPAIRSGRPGQPSENPVILRLDCSEKTMTLETLRLNFTGETGSGFEDQEPVMTEGIKLTKVSLKVPEGIRFEIDL